MAAPQLFKDYLVRYGKEERIYSAGDPGTEMYIVQSGSVEIFREAGGQRISLAVMEKGDFFGEMALIESLPHATCAEALEDSDLIEINSTLFDRMIKGNIEIAVRMLRKLSIRLRDVSLRLDQAAVASPQPPLAGTDAGPGPQEKPAPAFAAPPPLPETISTVTSTAAVTVLDRPRGCHAVLLGEDGQELFHIVSNRAAIGRYDPVTGLKPEIDLSTIDLNRSVSRHHARLTLDGGVYSITEEVGALNGTFINGRKLVSGKSARIKSGDVLNFGMVKVLFQEIDPTRSS